MCVATALLASGMINEPIDEHGVVHFTLEAPGGLIPIKANYKHDNLTNERYLSSITIRNVPSFLTHTNITLKIN